MEYGWRRYVYCNTEDYWRDEPDERFYRAESPDWMKEEHASNGFTYWIMKDDDWSEIEARYENELARKAHEEEVRLAREEEREKARAEEQKSIERYW